MVYTLILFQLVWMENDKSFFGFVAGDQFALNILGHTIN